MTLQPSRSRTSNEMKASTTNGATEPTTEVKPVAVEELTTGQRIVEVLEKRIRNLEKRKTKLDTIQKEALRGKEIHPGQQEALDKRDDVINQIESLKEMLDQTTKIVQDAKRGEKKEKDKARREAHATGVDRYQRIIRLLNIANHVDHDQFVRDLSDKASLEPLQGEFLLSVLSLLAGLGDEGSASTEWQAQAMHALFDCPSTFATSVKAPVFDSCKHVNVKQARELLDTLFDGVLESVALESVRTSSSPPPQTPNPSMNGDGLLLDSTTAVEVDQLSSTVDDPDNFSPPEPESRASIDRQVSAVDVAESKMVYAADLEKEIIELEQRQSSVRVPSPPPRIALPGEEEETKPVDPSQQSQSGVGVDRAPTVAMTRLTMTTASRPMSPTIRRPVRAASKATAVEATAVKATSVATSTDKGSAVDGNNVKTDRHDKTKTAGKRKAKTNKKAESKAESSDSSGLVMVPGVGCVSVRAFEAVWMAEPWPVRAQVDLLAEEESRYSTIGMPPTRSRKAGRYHNRPENMYRNKSAARRHALTNPPTMPTAIVNRQTLAARRRRHSTSSLPGSPRELMDRAVHPPFVCPIVDRHQPRAHTPIVQFGDVTVNSYNDDCVIIDESSMRVTQKRKSKRGKRQNTSETSFIVSAYPEQRRERHYSRGSLLACNTGHPNAVPLGALNVGRYVKTCSGHGAVDQLVNKPLTAFQYYMGVLHGINAIGSGPMPTMNEYGDDYYPDQGSDIAI